MLYILSPFGCQCDSLLFIGCQIGKRGDPLFSSVESFFFFTTFFPKKPQRARIRFLKTSDSFLARVELFEKKATDRKIKVWNASSLGFSTWHFPCQARKATKMKKKYSGVFDINNMRDEGPSLSFWGKPSRGKRSTEEHNFKETSC